MGEEQTKDRLMKIADNELRDLDKEQVEKFILWWGKWKNSVGWKRLARVLTNYAKEVQKTGYKKEEIEKLTGDWIT
jgi:hypothetical protein